MKNPDPQSDTQSLSFRYPVVQVRQVVAEFSQVEQGLLQGWQTPFKAKLPDLQVATQLLSSRLNPVGHFVQ
jgi:hypothetical protein